MLHYFSDPAFWVHLAFFVFLAIVIVKGRVAVKLMLDGKISEIIKEIENAQQLREEALGVLVEAKYKEQLAETRTRDMVQETEDRIRHIEDEARQTLNRTLAVQRRRMGDKIRRLELDTRKIVHQELIAVAIRVAGGVLCNDFHEVEDRLYVNKAIDSLPMVYDKNTDLENIDSENA